MIVWAISSVYMVASEESGTAAKRESFIDNDMSEADCRLVAAKVVCFIISNRLPEMNAGSK